MSVGDCQQVNPVVCFFVSVSVFVCLRTDALLQAVREVRRAVLVGGSRGSLHTID